MSRLSADREYIKAKQRSNPVFAVPANTGEFIQIDKIFKDGIFKVSPEDVEAVYDCCYMFEDINYLPKDETEQEAILSVFMKWLGSITEQFKIFVVSEHQDIDEYFSSLYQPIYAAEYPELDRGIKSFIFQKNEEGTRNIKKTMYLICTCRANSYEDAKTFFNTLEVSLASYFGMLGSRLFRLSTKDRLALIQMTLNVGERGIQPFEEMYAGDDWRNFIAARDMVQDVEPPCDYMEINEKYASVLQVVRYSNFLFDEKTIGSLIELPFPVYITLDYAPIPRDVVANKIENAYLQNQKTAIDQIEQNNRRNHFGMGANFKTMSKSEDLQNYLVEVNENDVADLWLGYYIFTYADTLDELSSRVESIRLKARNAGFDVAPCKNMQFKALSTLLPFGGRQMNNLMRDFLSNSLVGINPFSAKNLIQQSGFIYGLNRDTKQFIKADRKKLKAPHGMVFGHTGGGKSFLIKLTELTQGLLMTTDDIVVLDPNNEQEDIIRLYGGSYYDLTPQSEIYINPLECPLNIWEGASAEKNLFIAQKEKYIVAFMGAILKNITMDINYETKIHRATEAMYAEYFSYRPFVEQPTLSDFRSCLEANMSGCRDDELPIYRTMIDALWNYIDGPYNMFSRRSNLDMSKRLVGFGLSKIEDIKEPVMITVMNFMAERLEYNKKSKVATRFIVDECQILTLRSTSKFQLLKAIATYRKEGGIMTTIFQNISRVLEDPELRDIYSNCDYKVFFEQDGADKIALASLQDLSEKEKRALAEQQPGLGVMIWEDQVYKFDIVLDKTNELYKAFTTNFHEGI